MKKTVSPSRSPRIQHELLLAYNGREIFSVAQTLRLFLVQPDAQDAVGLLGEVGPHSGTKLIMVRPALSVSPILTR